MWASHKCLHCGYCILYRIMQTFPNSNIASLFFSYDEKDILRSLRLNHFLNLGLRAFVFEPLLPVLLALPEMLNISVSYEN